MALRMHYPLQTFRTKNSNPNDSDQDSEDDFKLINMTTNSAAEHRDIHVGERPFVVEREAVQDLKREANDSQDTVIRVAGPGLSPLFFQISAAETAGELKARIEFKNPDFPKVVRLSAIRNVP